MAIASVESWLAHWGYAAISLTVVVGNIGVPVPEESILLLSGYLAWRGALSLPAVLLVCFLSAVMGDTIGYWIGREGGRPLLLRYGRSVFLSRRQLARAEAFIARHGPRAVFFGRFIAGIRFLAGPLAGISRMPVGRFLSYNVAGAAVYVTAVVLAGYAAGPHLHNVLGALERAEHFLVLGVSLVALAVGWRILRRDRR